MEGASEDPNHTVANANMIDPSTTCVPEDITAGLLAAFPHRFDATSLSILATGANSVVVDSGEHVFRIGKYKRSYPSYRKESVLLPIISGMVDIAVPVPDCLSEPAPGLPYGAIGYKKLPGRPLSDAKGVIDRDQVARQIGEFVHQLHVIPVEDLGHIDFPEYRGRPRALDRLQSEARPHLVALLAPDEIRLIDRWFEDRKDDFKMQDYTPRLVHGDLACWNVLVDDRTSVVTGVVDFEAACIGDPADDLLTQRKLDDAFFEQVLEVYQGRGGRIESSFRHRVRHLQIPRLLFSLHFFAEAGDDAQVEKAVARLRRSELLSAPMDD